MLIKKLAHQLSKYDDIIFDLDNTLFDQSDYDIGAFKEIEKKLSEITQLPLKGLAIFLHTHKLKMGVLYPYLFNDAIAAYELPNHYLSIMLNTYYKHDGKYISKKASLIPTLFEILDEKRLFVVTNGQKNVQQTKIDRLQLNNYVCDIVLCEPKSPERLKPNRYAFDLLNKRHKLNSVVMVGDTTETDGLFAKNAKIPFIHFSYKDYLHENTK